MKYKLTNVSGQHIVESIPAVTSINLLPGENCTVSDVTVQDVTYTSSEIVRSFKQGRKPFQDDLKADVILEDAQVAKILDKFPANVDVKPAPIKPVFVSTKKG